MKLTILHNYEEGGLSKTVRENIQYIRDDNKKSSYVEICGVNQGTAFTEKVKLDDNVHFVVEAGKKLSVPSWIEISGKCYECPICHNEDGLKAHYKTKYCHDCGVRLS